MSAEIPQTPPVSLSEIPRLGLLAFEGQFPILIAQAAADLSIPVTAFGVDGITSPKLAELVQSMHWLELGQFEKLIQMLHEQSICHVIMVGRIQHNNIWRYRGFDRRGLKLLGSLINRKADSILGAVAREFASEGIEVLDSTLLIRNCMPQPGLLTPRRKLTHREQKDLEFGIPLARQIAGMDIGQTIVVKDLAVVAVESLEGTDETIRRAGHIAEGDVVVIKVAKPKQDNRFDVPVVGIQTIRSLKEAGGGVLAIMGGKTIFFDREESIKLAEESKIGIVAF